MTEIYKTVFAGMTMLTDQEKLATMLNKPMNGMTPEEAAEKLNQAYPGLFDAVLKKVREIESKRVRPSMIMYLNYRVQAWGLGFDVDPSSVTRIIPAGVIADIEEDRKAVQSSVDTGYKN